jgi:hypothetical protein
MYESLSLILMLACPVFNTGIISNIPSKFEKVHNTATEWVDAIVYCFVHC